MPFSSFFLPDNEKAILTTLHKLTFYIPTGEQRGKNFLFEESIRLK
jgi:hypothetical protein